MIGEFPAQRAWNAENVSIWWRQHGGFISWYIAVYVVSNGKPARAGGNLRCGWPCYSITKGCIWQLSWVRCFRDWPSVGVALPWQCRSPHKDSLITLFAVRVILVFWHCSSADWSHMTDGCWLPLASLSCECWTDVYGFPMELYNGETERSPCSILCCHLNC